MCIPRGKGHCTSIQTNPCTECILFCFYFCFLKDEIRTWWRAAVIWKLGSGVPLSPFAVRFVDEAAAYVWEWL